MLSKNFNTLHSGKKENIYKLLCNVFNKDNVEYFVEEKVSSLYQRDHFEYYLTEDFTEEKWLIFQKMFNIGIFSEKKKEIIKNIIQDLKLIYKNISIFNEIDNIFQIDLALSGGALRDLLLMEVPKIKDLDIILSFKYKKELLSSYFNVSPNKINHDEMFFYKNLTKVNENLSKNNIELIDLGIIKKEKNLDEMIKVYIFQLISKILSVNFNIIAKYQTEFKNTKKLQNIIHTNYIDKHLKGLIKIKDKKLNFDVDILLTSISSESYLNAYDYSLCKMLLVFVKDDNLSNLDGNIHNFIKNIVISESIYEDLVNNTCSFDIDNFTVMEVESSLSNHYPRLIEKYPHLRLVLKCKKDSKNKAFVDAFNFKSKLENDLVSKKEIIKTLKI